jgi:hypothetical protein
MTTLAYTFSSFSAALLSHVSPVTSNEQTPSPNIFAALCCVANDRLLPPDDASPWVPTADVTLLAEKTVGLLECLCWNVPEDLQNQYVAPLDFLFAVNTSISVCLLYHKVLR